MTKYIRRTAITLLITVAGVMIGCADEPTPRGDRNPGDPAATQSVDTPWPGATVGGQATAAPDRAPPETQTAPDASAQLPLPPANDSRRIVNTGGDGVALRSACTEGSRVPGTAGQGFREGSVVEEMDRGAAACRGWAFVAGSDGREGWVRLRYLASEDAAPWRNEPAPATWMTLLLQLDGAGQSCVQESLGPAEIAEAQELPLHADSTETWVQRFTACVPLEQAVSLALALIVSAATGEPGTNGEDAAQALADCYRPFLEEHAAIEHASLLAGGSTPTLRHLADEARSVCAPVPAEAPGG